MLQVDPNTGVAMYESDAIIKYLADKYGAYFISHLYISLSLGPPTNLLHLPLLFR